MKGSPDEMGKADAHYTNDAGKWGEELANEIGDFGFWKLGAIGDFGFPIRSQIAFAFAEVNGNPKSQFQIALTF